MWGRSSRTVLILAAGLTVLAPGVSRAQLVLYDDFEGRRIDPERWHGLEPGGGLATAPNTEASREVTATATGYQLRLFLTSYGATSSDSGISGGGTNRLRVNDPSAVTTMQAKVTLTKVAAQPCAANTTGSTRARAVIQGAFFNDGASTGPDDQTGDIYAGIQQLRDSGSGPVPVAFNVFHAFLFRCDDQFCINTTTLPSESVVFTTTWALGEAHVMRVQWDAVGNQFVFLVKKGASEELHVIPSAHTVGGPPGFDVKELRVRTTEANCVAGRRRARIEALFDNVRVNP